MAKTKVISMRLSELEYYELLKEAEKRNSCVSRILVEFWKEEKAKNNSNREIFELREVTETLCRQIEKIGISQAAYFKFILEVLVPKNDKEFNRLNEQIELIKTQFLLESKSSTDRSLSV